MYNFLDIPILSFLLTITQFDGSALAFHLNASGFERCVFNLAEIGSRKNYLSRDLTDMIIGKTARTHYQPSWSLHQRNESPLEYTNKNNRNRTHWGEFNIHWKLKEYCSLNIAIFPDKCYYSIENVFGTRASVMVSRWYSYTN